MCVGARSGSNLGPLGCKASALTNCDPSKGYDGASSDENKDNGAEGDEGAHDSAKTEHAKHYPDKVGSKVLQDGHGASTHPSILTESQSGQADARNAQGTQQVNLADAQARPNWG